MIKTIDECFFQIQNGANIKQGNADGGFPITRIETTANDEFNRDRMGYAGITDIVKYKKYILEDGDLLMSHINSMQYLGRTVLYVKQPNETIIHGMNLLRLKARRDVINPSYARYCFYGHKFRSQIGNITKKSVNQASFAVKDLKQIKIDIPSLDEQIKIAGILDKLQKLIDMRNEELEAFDNFVKSRFIEMFGDMKLNKRGWKLKSFEELTYLITDGEHATPKRTDKGIYLLSARNILNHSLQLKDVDYINEKEYDRIAKRIIPQEGDILISCSGTVGRCCSVPSGFHFQMVRSVALIRFKEYINPIFAEYMITSDYLQEQINSSKTVSSQANLFQGKIRTLKGFVPPIELQNQFADFVAQTDKSKLAVQKSLDELETLKKSLMQEYFG